MAAQLTLDIDMPDAAGLPAFRTSFKTDVATGLGIAADKVIITGVAAGSVIVDFYIAPADDGSALVEADAVTTALAAGVSVAGATLTADSVTSAPAVTAAPDAEPDTDPAPAPAPATPAPAPAPAATSGAASATAVAGVAVAALAFLQ